MSSFISSSIKSDTNFFTTKQLVVAAPAGLAGGESLIAFSACNSQNEAITATGWTRINAQSSLVGPTMTVWTRAHDATATSYTFGWAADEVGIMGGICAFSASFVASQHGDCDGVGIVSNPPGSFTSTLTEHTQSCHAEVVYAFFDVSAGGLTTSTLTMPAESTVRQQAYWIPADVGTKRNILAMATEEISGATEPARSADFTWAQAGANQSYMLMREVTIGLASTSVGYDFWG